MRALVIGGAGFIGSNLCAALAEDRHSIVSLDSYLIGSKKNHVDGISYVKGSAQEISKLCKGHRFNTVFHLGEYSRVEQSVVEPDKAIQNIYQTLPAVLEYCRANNTKLIYSASSTKFGDAQSPYSVAKQLNAQLVDFYMAFYKLPYVITYFYNAYGPGEIEEGPYATVVAKFIKAKRDNKSVIVSRPGTQKRNFTFVQDIVRGLIIAAEYGFGDGYGIGSDDAYSIIDLCDIIGVKYSLGEYSSANRMTAQLVDKKIRELGWAPTKKLDDYIKESL